MINFDEMKNPDYVWNNGFMMQWCCKCKALHVWHFRVVRGKTEDKDYIVVSIAGYPKLSELRKFYEKNYKLKKKLKTKGVISK